MNEAIKRYMVRCVALAIFVRKHGPDYPYTFDEQDDDVKNEYLSHARAGIEALREASDEMIEAGNDALHHDADARVCWLAMIDEALK